MSDEIKLYLNKILQGEIRLDEGVKCKKEVSIVEDNISESTLDIWCKKDVLFPSISQYESHGNNALEFEFAFGIFIDEDVNLYHYTLKRRS